MPFEYDQFNAEKQRFPTAEVNAVDTRTLAGDVTLSERDGRLHLFDNGGAARNITFFAATPENKGRVDWIRNTGGGAFSYTVKDSAGSTIATLTQNTSGCFVSNGTLHVRVA